MKELSHKCTSYCFSRCTNHWLQIKVDGVNDASSAQAFIQRQSTYKDIENATIGQIACTAVATSLSSKHKKTSGPTVIPQLQVFYHVDKGLKILSHV